MATTTSIDLRVLNTRTLVDTLQDVENTGKAYMFIGRSFPWPNDTTPPTPVNSVDEYRQVFDDMIALKRLPYGSVVPMVPRINWNGGVVYDIYRPDYSSANPAFSGAITLDTAKWITINRNRDVYICLDNKENSVSTVEPLNTGDVPFYTSDGYQWLRLYSITADELENRTTPSLIPVLEEDANDVVEITEGEIHTILIDNPGARYVAPPIDYWYCNVTGDGLNAVARVEVLDGQIVDIRMVRFGAQYTHATLDFRAGYVYKSLNDLDTGRNGLDPQGDGTFQSTVIAGPPGGWGTDLVRELVATNVGIFTEIDYNEQDFAEDITYRQIGVLKGVEAAPYLTVIENPETMNATFAVELTTVNAEVIAYTPGEYIYQTVTIDGVDRQAWGVVVGWSGLDEVNGVLTYIQDPRVVADENGGVYPFQGDNFIIGQTTGKIGRVVDLTGEQEDRLFQGGYSRPEVNKYTGDLIRLSNIQPIIRTPNQTENTVMIISY